jgi:hypothetical protein
VSNALAAFALVVARWAQEAGLPPGNLWEPAIVRNMEREHARLGGDALAQAAVIGMWAVRLGVRV